MPCSPVSIRSLFAALLIMTGLLPLVGCSGDGQPPGEVIEIETIEIIEPDEPAGQQPTDQSPPPQEPPADASN